MLDSIAVVLMVFMGLRDDRRPQGATQTSLFRTRDIAVAFKPSKPAAPSWEDFEAGPPR